MKRDEEKKDYPEGQMSVKQHKLLGLKEPQIVLEAVEFGVHKCSLFLSLF